MKHSNLKYPHPVLGQGNDISSEFGFMKEPEVNIHDDKYDITFELLQENGTISDYIKNEQAVYCCEASCTGTHYREIFFSNSTKFQFGISRQLLRNRVDFFIYCIAMQDIKNYSNPAAHEDYSDFKFQIDKADVLAIFGDFSFNADVEYHKLKAASSFMQIIPNDSANNETEYVLEDSKIQIKLPKEQYEKFRYFGKNKELTDLIHASLVQTALTIAIYNLEEHIENNRVWAISIQHRLLNEPELNNCSKQVDKQYIPELVQKLLGNPNKRLIDRLEILSNQIEAE